MSFKTKKGFITDDEIIKICQQSESIREVAIKLGYNGEGGGTKARILKDINLHKIDISHFKGQGHTKNVGVRKTPIEKYLNNEQAITSHKLRLRLLEDKLFEPKCNYCGNEMWMENPIPLELHHKDGNKNNNNLNNLELLCPNCHVFTDTYKSKNRQKDLI